MIQSSSLHAAIIMDGNGRWAERRGLPRTAGHAAGAGTVERIIEAAPSAGIGVLTLYAFSSDNWRRPMPEVAALMRLLSAHLREQRERAVSNGVAVSLIGRRDRLPDGVLREVDATEAMTAGGQKLRVRLAVDYSSREEIIRAAGRAAAGDQPLSAERFEAILSPVRPVDLLVRTGGEHRLSDFLLWECAYAELFFRDTMWPDFSARELTQIVEEFHARERRFGAIAVTPPERAHLKLSR